MRVKNVLLINILKMKNIPRSETYKHFKIFVKIDIKKFLNFFLKKI